MRTDVGKDERAMEADTLGREWAITTPAAGGSFEQG